VLHAHDYGPLEFMRRYFDEYRGLHESTGHVEPFHPLLTARDVRSQVAADLRWMNARGMSRGERTRWGARAALHHGGRRVFSALGSRAGRVPAPLRRGLSLEGRTEATRTLVSDNGKGPTPGTAGPEASQGSLGDGKEPALPPASNVDQMLARDDYDVVARVWQQGPTPLLDPVPGMAERARLRLALVIPPFGRGSGGHNTLFQLLTRLEQRGHTCSVWLADYHNERRAIWPAVLRREITEFFAPLQGPVYKGFDSWQGADIAIATGWQTVHATLGLAPKTPIATTCTASPPAPGFAIC
jgi:hypothetical protein